MEQITKKKQISMVIQVGKKARGKGAGGRKGERQIGLCVHLSYHLGYI